MLEKYKKVCSLCNRNFFSIFLTRKDIDYICINCLNRCKKLNGTHSDVIKKYSIEDLNKSIAQNKSISQIQSDERAEAYAKQLQEYREKRKKEYLNTLSSINIIAPERTEKVKRKYIKDIPEFNYSQVRKNIPQSKLENFVVIDTETTGLKPSSDELLEISAIKFIDANPVDCLTTLLKPKKDIPQNITSINHITNEMVSDSPRVDEVISSFSEFIKGYNIVGYNLEFDLKFLHCNGMEFFDEKRQFYDVLQLCKKCIHKNDVSNYKLDTIASHCNLFRTQAHRATEDALITGILFRDLGNSLKSDAI